MKEPLTKESIRNFILFLTILASALFIGFGFVINMWTFLIYTGAFIVGYWACLIFMFITNATIVNMGEAFIAIISLVVMVLCAIYEIQLIWFNY